MFKFLIISALSFSSFSFANERINHGETVDPTLSGIVKIVNTNAPASNSLCTGYLLTSSWVLTDGHCFDDGSNPSGVEIYMPANPSYPALSQVGVATNIYIHPSYVSKKDTQYDVALIKITNTPFMRDNFSLNFRKGFFVGDIPSLIGKTISCYGYGRTETGTSGILKVARDLKVTGRRVNQLQLSPNSSGAMINHGDSGGPCFIENSGKKQLVAINTSASSDYKNGYALTYKGFKDFILDTMYKDPIELHRYGKRWMYNDDTYEFNYFYPHNYAVQDVYGEQCAGSKYNLGVNVDFLENDKLELIGTKIVKEPYCGVLGCGIRETEVAFSKTYTQTVSDEVIEDVLGNFNYIISTNEYGLSKGINSLKASCEMAIQCQENICFANSHRLVNGVYAGSYPSKILPKNINTKPVEWNPCNGGCYTYTTQSRFADTNGFVKLSKYNGSYLEYFDVFGGNGTHSMRTCGTTYIELGTGSTGTYSKGFEISAVCE